MSDVDQWVSLFALGNVPEWRKIFEMTRTRPDSPSGTAPFPNGIRPHRRTACGR